MLKSGKLKTLFEFLSPRLTNHYFQTATFVNINIEIRRHVFCVIAKSFISQGVILKTLLHATCSKDSRFENNYLRQIKLKGMLRNIKLNLIS